MAGNLLEIGALECPICFDLLRSPVTLPCGHSFCTSCIENYWPTEQQGGEQLRFLCPQCRKRFCSRPGLNKNIMLADLVEQLKKTAPPADRCAGPRDVACDVCPTVKKLKAVKSCLQCVVSYCETHLQPHHTVAMLNKHQLVAPSDKLQENICHQHNEVKKMYCRTDQQPVCASCCTEQHKDHDTVSSAEERALKQAELEAKKNLLLNRIQNKETEMQTLTDKIHDHSKTYQTLEKTSNNCSQMLELIKNSWHDVSQVISSKVRCNINQKNSLQNKLQSEVSELRKIICELEEMSSTQEHNHFLLLYHASASTAPHSRLPETQSEQTGTPARPPRNHELRFFTMVKDVIKLKDTILSIRTNMNLPNPVPVPLSLPLSEPNSRGGLLCFRQLIAMDPNTVNNWMSLSEENKRVTFVGQALQYPRHPDRFLSCPQVMGTQGMIGRSYWEVEVSRAKRLRVAVLYKDMGRNDDSNNCQFGKNVNSWALTRTNNKYVFLHNSVQTNIPAPVVAEAKIGVYLDHQAGTLSFFSLLKDVAALLHRVKATFTKPLYAGLSVGLEGDTARFTELLI